MPSYKKYLICASLLLSLTGCSNEIANLNAKQQITDKKDFITVKTKYFQLEDQYIIFALEYETQGAFANARELYIRLFENTNKYEYLLRYLTLSFQMGDFKAAKYKIESSSFANIKEEEEILRLYTLSLFRLKEFESAITQANNLQSKFTTSTNIELYATLLLQKKRFNDAIVKFKQAFSMSNQPNTLLSLVNIQYYYANQKEQAKRNIIDYLSSNGYIYNLSVQLLSFYEQEKQTAKIVDLLERMYESYKNSDNVNSDFFKRTRGLLVRYYAKDNLPRAISFLEKENVKDELLLALYRSANMPLKAYELLQYLYEKSDNLDYLAQIAILEFELAINKEEVIDQVVSKFEKALKTIDNPMYQNYLAYILIDYNKDIEKGIKLVKQALKKEPDNLAYIDTLAWGEYKAKNCSEAYKQMKIVVDKAGLDDSEIKLHWEKIKECTK